MSTGRPITDADRQRVAELHAQGLNRNEIARAIDRAQSTVSKIARGLNLPFDRRRTAEATKAKVADAKERRAALALKILTLAEQEADAFNEPVTLHSFGGKDHTYNSKTVDRPPARERRDMAATLNILVDRHARLVEMDASTGTDDAKSMLGQLGEALQLAADQLTTTPPEEG